ncbi:MAG TPA: PhoH family protein [Myxococcota bacterium]|nr:PhoH family protein [Myxococcota bacterium]
MPSKATSGEDHILEIDFADPEVIRKLSGIEHETLRVIAKVYNIRVGARGHTVNLRGPRKSVKSAEKLIRHLGDMIKNGREVSLADVRNAALRLQREGRAKPEDFLAEYLIKTKTGREVSARGPGQRAYVDALKKNDLVFAVGPAGTGKTFLAMAVAVMELNAERISRIILTRPAVEAGEKLGFLPGSLEEKVLPYLRPLYDALFELVGTERSEELVAHGVVEVAPLAFMRGRTLNDAFVILDEGQNTTPEQMKMALTRLGFGSKMVVTGDITQIDLAAGQKSGLIDAITTLENIVGVSVCRLSEKDVVRHPLVQSIVKAYDERRPRSSR